MSAATMLLLVKPASAGVTVVSDPTVNVAPVIDATPDVTPAVWSSGASDTVRWEMADTDAGPWSTVDDMPAIDTPYTDQTFGKVLRWVEAQGVATAESAATAAVRNSLANNLRAYWRLEEASGATRNDTVGSSHAALNGTVSQTTGKVGNGASFNNNLANYLSVPHNAAIAPAGISFTLAFWYKLNGLTNQGFLSKYGGSGGNEYQIHYTTTPLVRFTLFGNGSSVTLDITPSAQNTTTFYPVRAWYDLPTNKMWLQWDNLTPVSVNAPAGGVHVSNGPLRFGYWEGAARPGNAVLDEIAIWGRVLTDDEWLLYRAGVQFPLYG